MFKVVKLCLIWDFLCGFSCWTSGHGQKGPMKEGLSLHLSVRPIVYSHVFSELAHLFFLKLSMVLGAHIQFSYMCRIFLKKMMSKMVKKAQKTRFFGHFKKIKSFVLSGISVRWKLLWSFNILQKLGKIWFPSYGQKWLSVNEILVLFNRQYFINRLISDFDFWNVDRYAW